MTCDTPASPAATPNTSELLSLLREANFGAAARLLETAPLSPAQLQSLADGLMRRRRWTEAEWLFARLEPREAATEMKRCLSRNLAALQTRRPEIYQQLITLGATDAVGIAVSASGHPTILARRPDGTSISLSGGNDPLVAARNVLAEVKRLTPNGESVAVCGVGDGYLMQLLAKHPPELFMDTQQAVFVLEPQPQILLHALMIHDCADANGPIAQERFRWFIGADWHAQLDAAVEAQPSMGLPTIMLQQGFDGASIKSQVEAGINSLVARDAIAKREVEAYYARITPTELARVFGPSPARKPRVMLLTTRFSTVLQYSTCDTAEAFRELGWDAQVVIEPGPSHRLYQHTIRRVVADFKPDVVFQIDHLRREHRDLFPPGLPFVCWIQDHLSSLKAPSAAASITPNDFVLTDAAGVYSDTFGYPARQLIGLNKLTRVPSALPDAELGSGDDIVFVSGASHLPDQTLAARVAQYEGSSTGRLLLAEAGARLIEIYRDGGFVPTWIELLEIVRTVGVERRLDVPKVERETLAAWLFHPFNDSLYRQQALTWAADAADEMGATLALYGKGWERHPRLASYARGPVAYGTDLERLTRRSRINLQIVPYLCLHQRLLDGLVAGGFYLIRQHPADTEVGALLDFLNAHAGPAVRNVPDALTALPVEHVAEFHRRLAEVRPSLATSDGDDAVRIARQWAEIGLVRPGAPVLPDYVDTCFHDAASLRERLKRFLADPCARNDLRERQRASVVERFSYVSGMRRVIGEIGRLIGANARSESIIGRAA